MPPRGRTFFYIPWKSKNFLYSVVPASIRSHFHRFPLTEGTFGGFEFQNRIPFLIQKCRTFQKCERFVTILEKCDFWGSKTRSGGVLRKTISEELQGSWRLTLAALKSRVTRAQWGPKFRKTSKSKEISENWGGGAALPSPPPRSQRTPKVEDAWCVRVPSALAQRQARKKSFPPSPPQTSSKVLKFYRRTWNTVLMSYPPLPGHWVPQEGGDPWGIAKRRCGQRGGPEGCRQGPGRP